MIAPCPRHSGAASATMLQSRSDLPAASVPAGGAGFQCAWPGAESERPALSDAGTFLGGSMNLLTPEELALVERAEILDHLRAIRTTLEALEARAARYDRTGCDIVVSGSADAGVAPTVSEERPLG